MTAEPTRASDWVVPETAELVTETALAPERMEWGLVSHEAEETDAVEPQPEDWDLNLPVALNNHLVWVWLIALVGVLAAVVIFTGAALVHHPAAPPPATHPTFRPSSEWPTVTSLAPVPTTVSPDWPTATRPPVPPWDAKFGGFIDPTTGKQVMGPNLSPDNPYAPYVSVRPT